MPRLIPPELGNGKRPSDPAFVGNSGQTAVPVLDVNDETHEFVGEQHDLGELLTGAVVLIDNPRPTDASVGPITVHVGGSTLHEAATEVIGALPSLARDMPGWVASTDAGLAAVLAEHYTIKGYSTCKLKSMEDVK